MSTPAQENLQLAWQAMRRKDRAAARRYATEAARLDSTLEEPWLILAALATPEASVQYLQRALEINPASSQARKGMHWAAQRLRAARQSTAREYFTPPAVLGDTMPMRPKVGDTQPVPVSAKPQPPRSLLALAGAAIILLVVLTALFSVNNGWTVFARSASAERPVGMLRPPALTPPITPPCTPTPPFPPTPTFTPTPTETPTEPPTPTETPTPEPTETPTEIPPTEPPPPPISADGRWIDVNLSEQMLYAYDGDTLVNSFLVSTGTWQYPTVTGQFNVYVKYRYTDMSGPGYYLPDVPYTMYFYKGYGIHGTYWHSNFGTPMSHGCVNMQTDEAGWLFEWASVGTLVNVHY